MFKPRVYNALVGIEGGYDAYDALPEIRVFLPVVLGGNTVLNPIAASTTGRQKCQLAPTPTASREAAVATAAFKVLIHYFPADTTLLPKYTDFAGCHSRWSRQDCRHRHR